MLFDFPPYTHVFNISFVISIVLLVIAWKRRPAPGALTFAIFILSSSIWLFFGILEIGSIEIADKIIWVKLENLGIALTGLLWLIFVLDYTRNPWGRHPRNLILLSIIPVMTLLVVWTNELHGWYYSDVSIVQSSFGEVAAWQHGFWFWISAIYQYILIATGIMLLGRFGWRNPSLRKQVTALIIGSMIPILGNVAYIFSSNLLGGLDYTPAALAISQLIYAITIYRYGFLDLAVVARKASFDNIPDGIIVLNINLCIADINLAAEKMSGFTKEYVIGKALENQWPDLFLTITQMKPGEHAELSSELSGTSLHLEISLATLGDQKGGTAGKLIVLRNITKRKIAEEGLKESEQYFRSVIDSLRAGVMTVDAKTHVIEDLNTYAANLLGEEKEKITGHVCHKFVCPAAKGNCPVTDLKQEVDISEKSLLTKDGEILPIIKSVIPVTRKGREYLVESFVDISSLKRATAGLEAQKELIDRLLSVMPAAVLVADERGKVLLANRSYYDGFNLNHADVENRQISDILPVEELFNALTSISSGRKKQVQLEFRYRAGKEERILVGNVLAMEKQQALIILNDVTEDRLHQQKLYLADRLASVGEMAAGIAHELNNPLGTILLMSELLTEGDIPEQVKGEVMLINKEAKRASSVVKNLLTFSRKREAVKQAIQVNDILEDVLLLRSYEHKINNIEVEKKLGSEIPDILADYSQLQQVFLNIILNAEQAMIEASGKGNLKVYSEHLDEHIRILFSDNGPGIPKENMEHIFDPFFTTKEVGKGTGLGLSICYGIVRSHQGKIHVESELGSGTTFTVEFPVAERQRAGLPI
jgi:PAS domain S-box-containing protein